MMETHEKQDGKREIDFNFDIDTIKIDGHNYQVDSDSMFSDYYRIDCGRLWIWMNITAIKNLLGEVVPIGSWYECNVSKIIEFKDDTTCGSVIIKNGHCSNYTFLPHESFI